MTLIFDFILSYYWGGGLCFDFRSDERISSDQNQPPAKFPPQNKKIGTKCPDSSIYIIFRHSAQQLLLILRQQKLHCNLLRMRPVYLSGFHLPDVFSSIDISAFFDIGIDTLHPAADCIDVFAFFKRNLKVIF